jgi:hypothetical protein
MSIVLSGKELPGKNHFYETLTKSFRRLTQKNRQITILSRLLSLQIYKEHSKSNGCY